MKDSLVFNIKQFPSTGKPDCFVWYNIFIEVAIISDMCCTNPVFGITFIKVIKEIK